nr:MAG TPA: hypothetical protein [Caudoviricetes sp.]
MVPGVPRAGTLHQILQSLIKFYKVQLNSIKFYKSN